MKIGLFGGTFDPIHIGHLIIAEWIYEELQLEKIIFIPAGDPPHKQSKYISSVKHRLEMVRLAIEDNSKFDISEFEAEKIGKSYSVETLKEFSEVYKSQATLFWIIGSDSLIDLPNWFQPDKIYELSTVVVYPRMDFEVEKASRHLREKSLIVAAPQIEISSTEIRNRVSNGPTIRYLVPSKVEEYICTNGLYKN